MTKYRFIDLFAGCGGLSLGLSMAGLDGQFAIERDEMAFATFSANFLGERRVPIKPFTWPTWLDRRAWTIDELLTDHERELRGLCGQVEILAGGPPCQGFSLAGKRLESDPRNLLFEKYIQVVAAVNPQAIVLENVPGMKIGHLRQSGAGLAPARISEAFYEKLKRGLEAIGYQVHGEIVDASRFGVPQRRARLIVIGLRRDVAESLRGGVHRAFEVLETSRARQLKELRLPEEIPASDAISDLTTRWQTLKDCTDPRSRPGFWELDYEQPKTRFQVLMHKHGRRDRMDSMRLANHRAHVAARFTRILAECPRGTRMNESNRKKFGLKKHRVYVMSSLDPAPTITTLPDDVLHYSEPRILTVRESARLQTFPDWFHFRGKFTTGGKRRVKECPRYTQVGNAVPPFLARAIGLALRSVLVEAAAAAPVKRPRVDAPKDSSMLEAIA